jgi:hypothetical protein
MTPPIKNIHSPPAEWSYTGRYARKKCHGRRSSGLSSIVHAATRTAETRKVSAPVLPEVRL